MKQITARTYDSMENFNLIHDLECAQVTQAYYRPSNEHGEPEYNIHFVLTNGQSLVIKIRQSN